MKNFNDLTRKEQETYLMLPIIKELRRFGGQATTREVKNGVIIGDYGMPEEELTKAKAGKNGQLFRPFDVSFSFTIRNLEMADFIERPQRGMIMLTKKGRTFNGSGN